MGNQCQPCQTLDNTCRRDKFRNDIKPRQKLDISRLNQNQSGNLGSATQQFMLSKETKQKDSLEDQQNRQENRSQRINKEAKQSLMAKGNIKFCQSVSHEQQNRQKYGNNSIVDKSDSSFSVLKKQPMSALVPTRLNLSNFKKSGEKHQEIIYEGLVKQNSNNSKGKPVIHGEGSIKWPDKTVLEASFQRGSVKGVINLKMKENFENYQGEVQNNMANGYGVAIIKAKVKKYESESQNDNQGRPSNSASQIVEVQRYEGQWKNDKPHGNGKHIFRQKQNERSNSFYQGEFKNGQKTGKGKYQRTDFSGKIIVLYIGDFLQNNFHGDGLIQWNTYQGEGSTKMKYIGQWKYGKLNGKGKLSYPDGSYYEGDFLQNLREGSGKYVYTDGRVWKGEWLNNRQHGRGIYVDISGNQTHGVWREGMQIPTEFDVSQVNLNASAYEQNYK